MTWLAVWLIGVGLTDLLRSVPVRSVQRAAVPAGGLAVVLVGALAGLTGAADMVALVGSVVPLVAWVVLSDRSLRSGGGHLGALLVLASGAALLVGFSGFASAPGGLVAEWLAWADLSYAGSMPPERLLLVAGLLLTNLATGNIIVRLILVSIGAMRPSNRSGDGAGDASERLKGGRLLGPMERIFIIGLGLAGQITAASIVVAAKGLIRFPELQSARDDSTRINGDGIDQVTEYFLVGSFVSWLVALASLALAR